MLNSKEVAGEAIVLERPEASDGWAVNQLIAACPPLDTNSTYCNLLQSHYFSDTSVIARRQDDVVGFISGFIPPAQQDTLFIWQVAVAGSARGQGLAGRMLRHLLGRLGTQVNFMETTITADNQASWALFEGLARRLDAPVKKSLLFEREQHFKGAHDSEWLLRIGPVTDV